jgi:carboxymethylenebutenolidase
MWPSRLVQVHFRAWRLSTIFRAGASSTFETRRRFAHHGYIAVCANLYERAGQGNPDVAAKVRADGGISDAQMVGDTEAAVKWIRAQSDHNGKVGIFGSCSGGRHAFIYACQRKDVDACVEL